MRHCLGRVWREFGASSSMHLGFHGILCGFGGGRLPATFRPKPPYPLEAIRGHALFVSGLIAPYPASYEHKTTPKLFLEGSFFVGLLLRFHACASKA